MKHPFPWKESAISKGLVVDAADVAVLVCHDDAARLFLLRSVNNMQRVMAVRCPAEAVLRMDAATVADAK